MFRKDMLSAQSDNLYKGWLAEFRTPFFRSYVVNQPDLLKTILNERPMAFPKSDRISEGLRPLFGNGVFLANGPDWERQRRIIDPAFEGGRLRQIYPAMWAAADAAVARMPTGRAVEMEREASHAAADIIFRTLFSLPIEDEAAQRVFEEFRTYARSQPAVNLATVLPLPRWMMGLFQGRTRKSASRIRALITGLTQARAQSIAEGTAPPDLATKIMTTPDPHTGQTFTPAEMVDQVAIFFLAGHETSAAALGVEPLSTCAVSRLAAGGGGRRRAAGRA